MGNEKTTQKRVHTNEEAKEKILELYDDLFAHDGYGEMQVVMRFLRRGQKEIIVHCGKEYRFVVAYQKPGSALKPQN